MVKGKERAAEAAKTILMILLSLSAVFLAGKAFRPYGEGGGGKAPELLPLATAEPAESVGASRPVSMAVVNEDGRYGVRYDTVAVDLLFDSLGDLLGEALSSADAAIPVEGEVWEEALLSYGVYYDFPGMVSLPLLASWLGGETGLDTQAACLLLARQEGQQEANLYYMGTDGAYYMCNTQVQFRQKLDEYIPNGAFFAFQQPERYGGLGSNTMILPNVPSPPVYEGRIGVDIDNNQVLDALLDALSFSPQPNAVYPAADGWTVREAGDSLRLTRGGSIYYHAGEESDRYPVSGEGEITEGIRAAGELVRRAMAPYSGQARIYLDEMTQTDEGWILTYRYTLSGADVQLGQDGWCAQITIQNGKIHDYVLKLRRYEAEEGKVVLLPEYQAMYAMEAMNAAGRQLLLRYYDSGSGTVTPSWIAR